MNRSRRVRVLSALIAAAALASTETIAQASVPVFDHVFVIVMENHTFSSVIGDTTDAPYINGLVTQYGLANNYFAITHPSLPNYLTLTGGDFFGITSDCTTCFVNAPNIAADRIEPSGRTWKSYMEGMPSACFSGDSGEYAQKHDPLFYFNDIRNTPAECNRIVPFTNLATDLASASTTPNYAFISPNLCDDMHDSCSPTNNPIQQGDTWLKGQLPTILNSPAFTTQNTVVFIVWDEDDSTGSNQVPALVIGRNVKAGFKSATSYTHYSILKTIESAWGLSSLTTNDANANAMADFFVAPPASSDPGSPKGDAGTGAVLDIAVNREITTQFLPAGIVPVNDGYVVISEKPDGGCISDIAVFWNGQNLPGATQGSADRVLVISDDPRDDVDGGLEGGAGTSCLSDLDIQTVLGHPQYQPMFQDAGISTLAQLQALINQRAAGSAGAPLTIPESFATLPDGGTADNTSFTVDGGSSQTYALLDPANGAEQVPALPPWAVALLGGALVVPGLYLVKRGRLAGDSAAS